MEEQTQTLTQKFVSLDEVKQKYIGKDNKAITITYTLSEHMRGNAERYRRAAKDHRKEGTGVKLDFNPNVPLPPQCSFVDKDYIQRTTRYTFGSKYIDIQPQAKIEGKSATASPTIADREALKVTGNRLVVSDPLLNWYLDADNCPFREDFTGVSRGTHGIIIRVVDHEGEVSNEYDLINRQLDASNAVMKLPYERVYQMVAELKGVSFPVPVEKEAKTLLAKEMTADKAVLEKVERMLEVETNVDSEIKALVSRAMSKELLSFRVNPGFVAVKRNGKWENVKAVDPNAELAEMEAQLVSHLSTSNGELLKQDIEKLVAGEAKPENPNGDIKEEKKKRK